MLKSTMISYCKACSKSVTLRYEEVKTKSKNETRYFCGECIAPIRIITETKEDA